MKITLGARPARMARRLGAALAVLALLITPLGALAAPAPAPVIYGDGLLPAPQSSSPAGAIVLGCTVNSDLPLTSYQLLLDNVAVPTSIGGTGPLWFLRATVPVNGGAHTVSAFVTDSAGDSAGWNWQFTATGSLPPPTPRPTPPPPPGTSPTIAGLAPPPYWMVPAGPQRIAALFGSDTGFTSRGITLDGQPLNLRSEGAAAGHEALAAQANVAVGLHVVKATAVDRAGRQNSLEWSFIASAPSSEGDLRITPVAPLPGITLDSGNSVRIAARLESKANVGTSTLWLDGRQLTTEGGGPDPHQETIFLEATGVAAGWHNVRVQVGDSAGKAASTAWDFYVGAPGNTTDRVYYAATGYSVAGPFKRYWDTLGKNALQILGYPISGLMTEQLNDGKVYTVQYYERVRLEWHPENAGSEFEVLYGLLGTQFHAPDPPIPQPPARPGERYFPETGHLVRGPFLQKWQTTGGLRVHGFPISEELQEVSPTDGRVYLVQYFQRARFEYHPENTGTQYEILLGMLGRQLFNQRYPGR
jgi:hypothetical protein